jgi:plastocyanin
MHHTTRRRHASLLMVVALLGGGLFVGACGGGSSASGIPCPAKVDATVKALDGFKFDAQQLSARSGKWTMKLVNTSGTGHNFQIQGADGRADAAANGQGCAEFQLSAGTYTFYCSLPGHEAAGMKGTLTVS